MTASAADGPLCALLDTGRSRRLTSSSRKRRCRTHASSLPTHTHTRVANRPAPLQAESNPYKIRRSTTGHKSWTQLEEGEDSSASTRTSQNGFDIDSPTARAIKRRTFALLRVPYGPRRSAPAGTGFPILVAHRPYAAALQGCA